MLRIIFLFLLVSSLAMAWAISRKLGIVLVVLTVLVFGGLYIVHAYGEQKYMEGIYDATHLTKHPLERSGK